MYVRFIIRLKTIDVTDYACSVKIAFGQFHLAFRLKQSNGELDAGPVLVVIPGPGPPYETMEVNCSVGEGINVFNAFAGQAKFNPAARRHFQSGS